MSDPGQYSSPANSGTQTHIARLVLTNFRNYARIELDLGPGMVVLTGDNGAGKTNLLEAVSLLTPGRGLRRATLEEMARGGAGDGFAVHARVEGAFGDVEIGTGTAGERAAAGEPSTRRVRINATPARSADAMLDWLRVIWLTPAMDALFTGPASDRRRFIDRLVLAIDPAHGRRALDYEKAMRSRNRLLADQVNDDRWFEAIETQLAETGAAIAAARVEIVRLIGTMIERLPSDGAFPQADIALEGTLEEAFAERPAVEVEEGFRRSLADNRYRDRAAGRTLEGPHRSDLLVRHRPKAMPAALCSTGEQKALLTGLVLSHARLVAELAGAPPVLLLDEIAAHLDAGRRAALFDILVELDCQAFMTGTDRTLFAALEGRARFFSVSGGTITPD